MVVITARDWSKQLPSEYQQLLKHNITLTFDSFLQEVRERVGIGEQFWQRQDLPDICERWGRHLDPARVHVISVPAFKVDPEAVYRLFGEVVGFDFKALDAPKRDTNASFGVVEAEVLRRFNVALDGRLANYSEEYMPAVRNDLIRHCIARGASARLAVPPEHHEWVRELSQQRLDVLLGRGYTLHGDPKTLLSPVDVGQSVHEATDAEIAEAAISTLATFAVRTYERQRRARRAT